MCARGTPLAEGGLPPPWGRAHAPAPARVRALACVTRLRYALALRDFLLPETELHTV